MLEFIFAAQNLPFAVSLGLMFMIALFEGAGMLLGAGLSDVLDSFIPDFEAEIEIDAADVGSPNALSRLLGWLKVGKVPVLMLLVVLLTAFGLIGYAIQYVTAASAGFLLPAVLVAVPAFLGSLPVVRVSVVLLETIMPKDESTAVSTNSFIGRIATVTLGTAREDLPAEARVTDQHGTTHYIQVVPEKGHANIAQGVSVLLVRKEGSIFVGIENNDSFLNN